MRNNKTAKRALLPVGHTARIALTDLVPMDKIAHIAKVSPPLIFSTSQAAFLRDLQISATAYKLDLQADSARASGIKDALWSIKAGEDGHPQRWAAEAWLTRSGGKRRSTDRALAALRKQVKVGRPREYAKNMLAVSLAVLLMDHTIGASVTTSRNNGEAATKDGILAQLFQNTLTKVDGVPLADPFPYLQPVIKALNTQ